MKMAACLLLLLPALVAGCAPASLVGVSSLDPMARWRQDRQLETHEAGGVSFAATFERDLGDYLVFEVVVANRSDSLVTVEPTEFFFTLARSPGDTLDDARPRHAPADLQQVLARVDRLVAREESSYNRRSVLEFIGFVADAVLSKPEDGCCCEERERREREEQLEREAGWRQRAERHESKVADLGQLRDRWQARALHRTRLGPWESVTGVVALPARPVREFLESWSSGERRVGVIGSTTWRGAPIEECTLTLHGPAAVTGRGPRFRVRKF